MHFLCGRNKYNSAVEKVNSINSTYGIKEAYYNLSNNNTEAKGINERYNQTIDGKQYTILGPFKYNFIYGLKNNKPILTFDGGTSAQSYKVLQYAGSIWQEATIQSGAAFYIAVESSKIVNINNISLKFEVKSPTTTMSILLDETNGLNQPIVYLEQTQTEYYPTFTNTFNVTKKVNLTLQKVDANGNAMNKAGISFDVKNSSGTVVARITTDNSGKGTSTVQLDTNKTYQIVETSNSAYGYKKMQLTATLSGATITQVNNSSINIKLGNNVSDNLTLNLKNTQELADLKILKTDQSGNYKVRDAGFVIKATNGGTTKYLQLKDKNNTVVQDISSSSIIINTNNIARYNSELEKEEYELTYVNEQSKGTIFVTNTMGIITIKNLEVYASTSQKYSYTALEVYNNKYGYIYTPQTETITGLQAGKTNEMYIENVRGLGDLKIVKCDSANSNIKLPGVEFKVKISDGNTTKYLQLSIGGIDNIAHLVPSVTGTVTIDENNVANNTRYSVKYVEESEATTFITDSNGEIMIKNLEVNATSAQKYSYIAYEISNEHYGYNTPTNILKSQTALPLISGNTRNLIVKNRQEIGNLAIEKTDSINPNIKLPGVGFKVEMSDGSTTKYIQLKDNTGKVITSITGTATINSNNIANANEYHVEYVYPEAGATEFITDKDGKIVINNLELYSENRTKLKYKLIETSNVNSQYESNVTVENIELSANRTVAKNVSNTQLYIDISGYVWEELPGDSKSSNRDHVYTKTDKKLTDLYGTDGGPVTPVEIKLRNVMDGSGNYIKQQPDQYDNSTGEYKFVGIEVEQLPNIQVVFIYDGFEYTTAVTKLEASNGSKVKEDTDQRASLNGQFNEVNSSSSIIYNTTQDGDRQTSIVTGFGEEINSKIEASTYKAGLNLSTTYASIKQNRTTIIDTIENINMGIVLREQPKLYLGSDIHSVSVQVNNYNYDYYYGSRQYETINPDEVGVKFEQENVKNRYSRTIYSSDVQAFAEGRLESGMKVLIRYKISIRNQSATLKSVINEITNYFDSEYTIERVGSEIDKVTISNGMGVQYGEIQATTLEGYKSTKITFGDSGLLLTPGETKNIYIEFNVSQEAIKGLLTGKSTYHNATEITRYTTIYGENTNRQTDSENNIEYFTTDQTAQGEIYAGVDQSSKPGNIVLSLIEYKDSEGNTDGTKVLDKKYFEDDSNSAPSLLLEAVESRRISGKVFEDAAQAEYLQNNERRGNGIYDYGENVIYNAIAEMYEVNEDGTVGEIAKYSNGVDEVRATTNGYGDYSFGYYDEEEQKYVGILPGRYVIKYTYNRQSRIDSAKLNANDYKSTIISDKSAVYNGFENSDERWYAVQENTRYSSARDYIDVDDDKTRLEYKTGEIGTMTNENYQKFTTKEMSAYTPIMDIGIEFSATDEELDTNAGVLIKELKQIDFGITERPYVDMAIQLEITGLEVISSNGAAIISKGDPTQQNMQTVKALDGKIASEIESDVLQGAQLNIEYTITLKNKSEKDYLTEGYYYYGTHKENEHTPTPTIVVDYLDGTMELSEDQKGYNWQLVKVEDLVNYENGRLISKEVEDQLKKGDYKILITQDFKELEEIKLYTSKVLSPKTEVNENNSVEILGYTGKRPIKESIPGDYIPSSTGRAAFLDQDQIAFVITPPTGTTVNYMLYIISGFSMLIILVTGIIIVKKKILK